MITDRERRIERIYDMELVVHGCERRAGADCYLPSKQYSYSLREFMGRSFKHLLDFWQRTHSCLFGPIDMKRSVETQ